VNEFGEQNCFLNSVLQAFWNIPVVKNEINMLMTKIKLPEIQEKYKVIYEILVRLEINFNRSLWLSSQEQKMKKDRRMKIKTQRFSSKNPPEKENKTIPYSVQEKSGNSSSFLSMKPRNLM
jgi:hypothetical protein